MKVEVMKTVSEARAIKERGIKVTAGKITDTTCISISR